MYFTIITFSHILEVPFYKYMVVFLFNTAIYVFLLEEAMYSYRSLCIHTVAYVFLDAATLTEVFPSFFLSVRQMPRYN